MMRKITGTGGETPIWDGTMRGAMFSALSALLLVFRDELGVSDADAVALSPVLVWVSFVIGGLWDRFIGPRI